MDQCYFPHKIDVYLVDFIFEALRLVFFFNPKFLAEANAAVYLEP